VVRQRYKREAMASAFRILGEGQLSLTKFLIATDGDVDLRDFPATLRHVLARADFRTDLFLFANLSMDSLDYAGPRINEGSKGVLLGVGDPIRELPRQLPPLDASVSSAAVFCPGCLVVQLADPSNEEDGLARLPHQPGLERWPLVVVVTDLAQATASSTNFLWTVFTRFDPAQDLHSADPAVFGGHVVRKMPLVLDARMKPQYPAELFCDPETETTVTRRWTEYFPAGMEMGDSSRGHLDEPA
jgi:3-polyprenyl-4-hydroxybenzoate decarboxylase